MIDNDIYIYYTHALVYIFCVGPWHTAEGGEIKKCKDCSPSTASISCYFDWLERDFWYLFALRGLPPGTASKHNSTHLRIQTFSVCHSQVLQQNNVPHCAVRRGVTKGWGNLNEIWIVVAQSAEFKAAGFDWICLSSTYNRT